MNSGGLQQLFRDEYVSFFSSHDVVLSTSLDVILNNDMSIALGGFVSYQKVPLKLYLGIRRLNDSQGIRFASLRQFKIAQNCFSDVAWPSYIDSLLSEYQEMFDGNFVIDVLVEDQRGTDLSFSGPLCALLASFACLEQGIIKHSDLASFSQMPVRELYSDSLFQVLYVNASDLICAAKGDSLFGSCVFSALSTSMSPIICRKNEDALDVQSATELASVSDAALPLDLSLLFSGLAVDPDHMVKDLDDLYSHYSTSLDSVSYSYTLTKLDSDSFRNSLVDSWEHHSVLFIDALRSLYLSGGEAASRFCSSLTLISYQLSQFSQPGLLLDGVIYNARSYLGERNCLSDMGVKHFYNRGNGGSLLFASGGIVFRDFYDSFVSDSDSFVSVFSSWQDGYGKDGVILEQGFGKQSLFASGAERLRNLQLGLCEYSADDLAKYPLFFDAEHSCIYMSGEKMDSKTIRSSSMTMAFVRLLFESSEVVSSELPHSSFTESATEFSSKIIKPLVVAAKESLAVDLDFSVDRHDDNTFSVKLLNCHDLFYLLDKKY